MESMGRLNNLYGEAIAEGMESRSSAVADLAKGYAGRRILLTGGTGFIGSHVARVLVQAGARVRCIVRPLSNAWRLKELANHIEWAVGDMRDEAFLKISCERQEIVFHLAAEGVRSREADYRELVDTNIRGTCGLIFAAAFNGVCRIIQAGTCFEYGSTRPKEGHGLTPEDVLKPTNLYGASKAASSLLSIAIAKSAGIEFAVLRLFHTYGPAEDPTKFVPTVIQKSLIGEPVLMTKGEQVRDYCYVEDVAEAFLRAGLVPLAEPRVLNIGSGTSCTIAELAEAIVRQIPESGGLRLGALPYRPDEMWYLLPDLSETYNILGWKARYTLKQGIIKTISWYRDHPQAEQALFRPWES